MKLFIAACILGILLSTCKNDITPTTYVSGTLFENCGGPPAKNRGLYIYQQNAAIGVNNTNIIGTGSTDSYGNFRIPLAQRIPHHRWN